ncbi:MAG: DsbE family thiol:disulfide interchange protein [Pseudomonadota bacterium]
MNAGDQAEKSKPRPSRVGLLALSPLIIALVLAGIFGYQLLFGDPAGEVPSVLVGRAAPTITLEPLPETDIPGFSQQDFVGNVTLVNVFASWCAPCRQEHPLLMQLSRDDRIQVIGINQKDRPADARRFLTTLGNPYDRVGVDPNGRASIEWGVYGVPETFIVGQDGTILHKHIGAFDQAVVTGVFLPLIEQAFQAPVLPQDQPVEPAAQS